MLEIKVPSPGEAVSEVMIEAWLQPDGTMVKMDDPLADLQSDKATLTVFAEKAGVLKILVPAGETVEIGRVIATIDPSAAPAVTAPATPAVSSNAPVATPAASAPASGHAVGLPSPAAQKLMAENNLPAAEVNGTGPGGRITKGDVLETLKNPPAAPAKPAAAAPAFIGDRTIRREKMTMLRKTLAARLVSVKNETAMLTTFNEVDLTVINDIRKKYKDTFKEKYGIGLGFMSFFTKACSLALKEFPAVNAQIDGEEIVYHNYVDMGIAVSTDRGLVVPVVRNAESLTLAQIEQGIADLAAKGRNGKLTIADMQGGTFTITNGGVFGSLMSTPILNPPQSAILGMHKIQERPMVINGQVVPRPMMYLALSYDHRIIDGKESVSFLVRVKEYLEDPFRMLLEL
jgi:2-oxoglutarate dehydrogenase E2 component (dihydrolipoamide succinyltransferase)